MNFIKKNPNEVNYVGGKKHWQEVIKNTGPSSALIWRQPEEDFNNNSRLVVMPGEIAIFMKGGIVQEVIDKSGTFILSTENYPFISRLINQFSGGVSRFNCLVYFVRTNHSQEVNWGTSSPLQIRDSVLGVVNQVKAHGAYTVRIKDAQLFLEKLAGSGIMVFTAEDLDRYFANKFQGLIRTTLINKLNSISCELIEIEKYTPELEVYLKSETQKIIEPYGVECIQFTIAAMETDDNGQRTKVDDANIDILNKIREKNAELELRNREMEVENNIINSLGDNYTRIETGRMLHELVNNPQAGSTAATGAGLGMGLGAMNVFSNMVNSFMSPISGKQESLSADSSEPKPSGRFCTKELEPEISEKHTIDDDAELLATLRNKLDNGRISQATYDALVDDILRRK